MQKPLYIPLYTIKSNNTDCTGLVKYGDSLELTLKVFDDAGKVLYLTGKTVNLIIKKQDATIYQETLTNITDTTEYITGARKTQYIGSKITTLLDVQATNSVGKLHGELQISDTNGSITTNTFTLLVIPSLSELIIENSVNEIQILSELIEALKEYIDLSISVAGTIKPIQTLSEIKNYIDTNLPLLQSANSQAITNITNEGIANDELETAISTATALKSELDDFVAAHADITNLINAVNTHSEDINSINADLSEMANNKVDKVTGKGLSTNDYDNTEKAEVEKVALKADTTYVNGLIGNMGSSKTFKGSCTDAELTSKTGMVVDDYWYITDLQTNKCYNGTSWVDIGNALKLGDGTVIFTKLDSKLQSLLQKVYSSVPLTWHNGSYYKYTTGVITTADTNFNYADIVSVTEGEQYRISGRSAWEANLYVITDSSGNILNKYPNTNASGAIYNNVEFIIPANGSKLLINKTGSVDTILERVTAFELNGSMLKSSSVGTDALQLSSVTNKIISDESINTDKLSEELKNTLSPNYTPISLIFNTGAYYKFSSGTLISDSSYSYANAITVSEGEKYRISGESKFDANLYVITDSSGNVLMAYPNASASATTYNDIEFTIPIGGVNLLINKNDNVDTILERVDSYSLVELLDIIWCAFGDSLTASTTLGGAKNYVDFISDKLGLNTTNCGVGGTGYLNDNGYGQSFIQRVSSIPIDTKVITIFGSFNDLYVTGYLVENLKIAMQNFINAIYERVPDITIGIISPTPWSAWNRQQSDQTKAAKAIEYVNAQEEICKYNSIPCLNLFDSSNTRPWDTTYKANNYLNGDGTHPLTEIHKNILSPKIQTFIESLVRKYNY